MDGGIGVFPNWRHDSWGGTRVSGEAGLLLTCYRNVGILFSTKQGNRPSTPDKPDCLTDSTVTQRIYSKHEERCDSPVAPQAKALDPYVTSTGRLTPILHLERKVEFHVSTRDEA